MTTAHGQSAIPAGLVGVSAIAAGADHSLALKNNGTVVAWGSNGYGQTTVPAGSSRVTAIAAGADHSLALKSDGTVVAWGYNGYGQTNVPAGPVECHRDRGRGLLQPRPEDRTAPSWPGATTPTARRTSRPASRASRRSPPGATTASPSRSDGTVVAWGYNAQGQTAIPAGLSGVSLIAAGGYHSLALEPATPSTYHPITPVRLLDTRYGNGLTGKLSPTRPDTFQITGRSGIPAGVSAVTGNLTVTGSSASWAVYLGPNPNAAPTSSTINFGAGETTANGVTVALSASGTLSATYMGPPGATTDLVFDVTGYFTPDASGDTYHPMNPVRELDTRYANGLSGKLTANTPACFGVAGRNGVPADAKAVSGNVTVVGSSASWAVYVGPISTATPTTSSLNFEAGQVKANNLTAALDSSGRLCATYMGPRGSHDRSRVRCDGLLHRGRERRELRAAHPGKASRHTIGQRPLGQVQRQYPTDLSCGNTWRSTGDRHRRHGQRHRRQRDRGLGRLRRTRRYLGSNDIDPQLRRG